MGELTINQYTIVADLFSLMIAAMGASAVFFFLQRGEVLQRFRMGVTLLGLMSMVSSYSYYRLYTSWTDAYHVVNGVLRSSGTTFNEGYRFVDWLLTVPLLLVAFLSMMDLGSRQARLRSTVLAVLSAEMILLGYPGQLATTVEARALWWVVAMLPALIIVYQLYVGLTPAINAEPLSARRLFRAARLLTVSSWTIYPAICPASDLRRWRLDHVHRDPGGVWGCRRAGQGGLRRGAVQSSSAEVLAGRGGCSAGRNVARRHELTGTPCGLEYKFPLALLVITLFRQGSCGRLIGISDG